MDKNLKTFKSDFINMSLDEKEKRFEQFKNGRAIEVDEKIHECWLSDSDIKMIKHCINSHINQCERFKMNLTNEKERNKVSEKIEELKILYNNI